MKIKVTNWKVSTLLKRKDIINAQPEYQRGEVWSEQKKSLLIDSILRGIDIPKVYLRVLNNSIHKYEVSDGQQRLNAIFSFARGDLKLLKKTIKGLSLNKINGFDVGGLTIDSLPEELKERFNNFEITLSIIENCSENEVRVLFGRLQEGVTLNPAEKRNSIISTVGKHIDSIALNHIFFEHCKISKNRFKHQDYLSHVFALIIYENKEDLKSKLLEKLYLDAKISLDITFLKKMDSILDNIYRIDSSSGFSIKNKYTFIDLFWLLNNVYPKTSINIKEFREKLNQFEKDRLYYRTRLNTLSKKKDDYKKKLYSYILAYDRSGSITESIEKRRLVFNHLFSEYIS